MARFRDLVSAFLAGEISPRLHARTEVQQFKEACEELTNMYVYPQGGAARRPGTQFMDSEFSDQEAVRLIPFIKSKTESYVIVFTLDLVANPKGIKIWDVVNKTYLTLDHSGIDTPGSTYSGVLPTGPFGELPRFNGYTTAAELQEIQYCPFGNAIFFTQKDHPPFAIDFSLTSLNRATYYYFFQYFSLGVGTAGILQFADSVPYDDRAAGDSPATMAVTALPSPPNPAGTATVTCSAGFFTESMVGSFIRITGDSAITTGVGMIYDIGSSTLAYITILRPFEDANPTANWALSSWSDYKGWPKAVTFFENRIAYGYTFTNPNMIWESKTGNLSFMRQEQYIDETPFAVTNADAWSFRISSKETNVIQWLSGGKTFFIGALGAEYIGFGPDNTLSMGPLNFNFSSDTAVGSAHVQPVRRDNVLFFIQRSGRMIREVSFNLIEDNYRATKVMTLAEHMPRKTQLQMSDSTVSNGEIVEMVHQEADNQITWFRDSNGGFFGMSRDRDTDGSPTAFHYHQIAGVTTGTPGAKILSMCVVPSADGTHDDLYLAVRRSWNSGPDRTYLEKIGREFEGEDIYAPQFQEIEDKAIYLDSAAISIEDPAIAVHVGFDHLYNTGEVVQVIADGHYVGEKTVDSSGQITLDVAAGEVIAGMKYRSQVIPVQINMGSVMGTSQGADKTLDQIFLKFINTIGGVFGFAFGGVIDETQMYDINFRDPNANQNDPIQLFSGVKELSPPLGYDTKINVVIRQDLPFPQHITSIVYRGVTND